VTKQYNICPLVFMRGEPGIVSFALHMKQENYQLEKLSLAISSEFRDWYLG
jgi:hypothetical protein